MSSVQVVSYNPEWPTLFQEVARSIHHIGSTAVPGLDAKPIIDMILVARDEKDLPSLIELLSSIGLIHRGEMGIPFREFFQVIESEKITHHIHCFTQNNPEIDHHLRFRDWVRSHADDRDAYGKLKKDLAQRYPNDRNAYCRGKDAFITEIDAKAGFDQRRLMLALHDKEWEAYHRIREEQIFRPIKVMYDRQHPSFTSPCHFHFVLYKGTTIVAGATIEFLNEKEAALRSIATDEPCKKQGHATYLLKRMETWVQRHGRHVLRFHANPRAEAFYRKRGYIDMPWKGDPSISPDTIDLGKVLE